MPLLIKTDPQFANCNLFSAVVTVWTLTWIEGYLYQSVHLISFFAVFSEMWTLFLSQAFGSNQLRQRIIKIYDSHSDSHRIVTAIATRQLHQPHPQSDWHPLHHLSSVWFNDHLENCQNTSGAPDNSCAVCLCSPDTTPSPNDTQLPPVLPPKVYECLKLRMWGTSEKGCQVQRTQWQSPLTIGSGIKEVTWVKLG